MKTKYIIVDIADRWYEERQAMFVTYSKKEAIKFLKKHSGLHLIQKLEFLEKNKENFAWNGNYELVISNY